jgi:hypothetical protein
MEEAETEEASCNGYNADGYKSGSDDVPKTCPQECMEWTDSDGDKYDSEADDRTCSDYECELPDDDSDRGMSISAPAKCFIFAAITGISLLAVNL